MKEKSHLSDSEKRRVKLLTYSFVVAIGINFLSFTVLLLSGDFLISLINLSTVLFYSISLIISLQKKYSEARILFIYGTPLIVFLIQLFYAENINIHLYLLSEMILAIFIFKSKRAIYLSLVWSSIFFLLMSIGLEYQFFPVLIESTLAWTDFFWWGNLIGTVLATIIFASTFRMETFNYETKMRQQNTLLSKQSEEIKQSYEELQTSQEFLEKKQIEITEKNIQMQRLYENLNSSIKYAQRIQQAILPSTAMVNKLIPSHFILFKPRDIVSGDFYYVQRKHGKTILAAIDCTGHGVPGAFMSMVGNDLLNTIIKDKQITQADKMLTELHEGVRSALQQEETQNQDGMDMALVVIDEENKTLEFAGAKNPLIYIQNSELKIIKGDKTPIGGLQKESERTFTTHQIDISQSTTFYLFSDGYQDQFGGLEGRKFMIKRFRNLLFEIHEKPMDEQREVLNQTIQDWMNEGNERQVDDILVIGFKL